MSKKVVSGILTLLVGAAIVYRWWSTSQEKDESEEVNISGAYGVSTEHDASKKEFFDSIESYKNCYYYAKNGYWLGYYKN